MKKQKTPLFIVSWLTKEYHTKYAYYHEPTPAWDAYYNLIKNKKHLQVFISSILEFDENLDNLELYTLR